ncbi:MAG: hypothetical protein AAF388_20785 [Bacteroidota bacterium]
MKNWFSKLYRVFQYSLTKVRTKKENSLQSTNKGIAFGADWFEYGI